VKYKQVSQKGLAVIGTPECIRQQASIPLHQAKRGVIDAKGQAKLLERSKHTVQAQNGSCPAQLHFQQTTKRKSPFPIPAKGKKFLTSKSQSLGFVLSR
jgi:hypothetical protein